MKEHIIFQRLYGLMIMSRFIFLSDTLSLKGKKLDFYGKSDTYVSLAKTIPELSQFTTCIDMVAKNGKPGYWKAFSYITNNTVLGREDLHLGLAGDHRHLILHNLGKTFYITYRLIPFKWYTICLIWDGVKGRLDIFLNQKRLVIIMDEPRSLTPNGTLVLGHLPKNEDGQVKKVAPHFTGSLYYFQLWDRILETEEFMKCLDGNIISWEEDIWLLNKIIPTVDRTLRCFLSENMTIEETSTPLLQQINLTTPSQITELRPQKTVHVSAVMSKSVPMDATNYTTLSYSNKTSSPVEIMTASKNLRTSIAETATFAADGLSSAAISRPTQSTSICTTTDSMKITKSSSSESKRTTKMAEVMSTKTSHPTIAINFLSTSGFTKNSSPSETSAESQSAIMKTTSLFSFIESTSMSTTSWPKQKSTVIPPFPFTTSGQEFLVSTAARTVPWSTVEETSGTSTVTETASTFPPESVLISTVAPVDSIFTRNQTISTLAKTDVQTAFTVHSVMSFETTPAVRTAETEWASTNFQNISSPRLEDAISTSMTKDTSSMAFYSVTSSPITRTQNVQTVVDAESSNTAFTPAITLTPTVAKTTFSTITGSVHTHNTPTAGEHMLTLISTKSLSTSKASESGSTPTTDESAHGFSTNGNTWTSRPEQTLVTSINTTTTLIFVPNENFTSALHGNITNTGYSPTTTNIITPLEASTESKTTTSTDTTTARYTTAVTKIISPQFANFLTISGTTNVTNLPEFKFTTLLLKTNSMSTVGANELPSTPKETVVPSADITSTLADIKLKFSTEENTSEVTQTETNGTSTFGDTTAPVPKSVTTERFNVTVTRKETTSHHLKEKSTIAAVAELSQFSTMLEMINESAQTVTAFATVSPFPDTENLTNLLDHKTVTTEVGGNWFSTNLMQTTPKSPYNGATEIFNSTHNYSAHWISETPGGNSALSLTSGKMQTFPELLDASTTRILEASVTTIPTDRTALFSSADIIPPKTAATHSSVTPTAVTHMFSLPVNVSAVTSSVISMVVSDETKVTMSEPFTLAKDFSTSMLSNVSTLSSATKTTALVPQLSQTASTTSDAMPTYRISTDTTSEAVVISTTMTPMAVPPLTETVVSMRPLTPVTSNTRTILSSTSADTVTPSTHTLVCSKPPPDNIPFVSSTHLITTTSASATTQPISQVEKTSTYGLSFPYTFSSGGNTVSLATGTTETSVVDEDMSLHTSAKNPITSVGIHVSQPSTHLVNTPVFTQLATGTSNLSSDQEQITTSLGKTTRTLAGTEMSPSKNSFISYSQGTSSLEMTDTEFSETTKPSSYQTHSPSEIQSGTIPDGNSTSFLTSGSTQATPTLTSSKTADVHISEMSTSLGKTIPPSQALKITTFLSPDKESTSDLHVYTPRTTEMIVNSSSTTHLVSYHQNNSIIHTITPRATRISNNVLINTTLSDLPSLKTQPEITSLVASSTSESIHTFPKSLSPSTAGLSNNNFTMISTNGITTVLSVTTTLLGETSMTTSIPVYHTTSLPVNATTFTSRNASDTPTIPMTKSSKTTHSNCLKNTTMTTSGPTFEMSSRPINDSVSLPAAGSFDTSTTSGSFSILWSSTTPKTAMTTQTSTLNAIPVTYVEPTSELITPTATSFPTQPSFLSMKTISTTLPAGIVTSVVGSTATSLLSSKNSEAISSIPTSMSSPLLSTIQQSLKGDEATTLGILLGITNSSRSAMSSGRVTSLTNTYSRTPVPENGLLPTPLDNLHTSLNIQVSPSSTDSKNTFGSTKSVKGTTIYLSSNTGNVTSLSENISLSAEITKTATSGNTPVLYPSWTPSNTTTPSLTSLLYSPHGTEANAEFSTPEVSLTSQMVEYPVLGTRITSSNTKSLLTTSWNTPRTEDSQFPISTTTHVPTPKKMETETLHLVPGSLSTYTAPQTGLVSKDVMAMSSITTSEIFPTFGISESSSLSTSLRDIFTSSANNKHTFEKTTTSVMPRTTYPSNPSKISKTTTSSMLTWILSSLPSGFPLVTITNAPHVITSSPVGVSKSTFPTSSMISTYPHINISILPFATESTTLTKTTPTPTLGSIINGSPTSLPISTKITDDNIYISTTPEVSSRATMTTNSRTMSQPPSVDGMSMSHSTANHTPSVGSMSLPKPTKTSAWSTIPAESVSSTLTLPNPILDYLINTTTTTSSATGALFSFSTTGITHPSKATVTSLKSSSFETTWMDSTYSFLSTEALTSPVAAKPKVSFYNIEMSFSVFDEEPRVPVTSVISELAKNWLNYIFQDSEFSLANLAIQIKSRKTSKEEMAMDRLLREEQGMTTISHVPYSCACQVIIKADSSLESTELIIKIRNKIHGNFSRGNFTQDQFTLLVTSEHITVKKLDPGKCEAHETPTKYKGTYKWLLTYPTETAQTRCIKNEDGNATRICSISIQTGKSQWEKPRFKQCRLLQGLPEKIVDLANITISDENADDVAEHILNLINESPPLDEEETKIIVYKVAEISKCDEISMNLTQIILQIINAVLEKQNNSTSNLHQVSNEILRIIERAGHKMEFSGRTANLTVTRLALAVLRVDHTFKGMAFGIRSYEEGADPQIYLGNAPLERVLASIYLPKSLREKIPLNNLQTILFSFFGQTSLFKIKNVMKKLTTYVMSASISDMSIQNLADPVLITLQHIEGNWNYDQVHCAFWDFETNNGLGGWNSSGCKVKETNINYTICQCDHLTHFGVLMDLSRSTVDAVNEQILVLITNTGCGISSIFLGIAMVTYIAFHKLRKDYPSKILINLCTALLMLNLAFLVNSWLSSFQKEGLCVTSAVALHYFLLVSLTWMGLEAVHMYFALVKVFNIYIPYYILKFCLIGWGIPAIAVAIILTVRKDLYGILSPTTQFCWIKDDSLFYISVVAYFCLIFLMNLSMFCIVLAQLNSMKSQSQKTRQKMILHDLKGTLSLTFLLGLTWGFAFFAWGPMRIFFLYLFAICNTLQGFLIFVFYCVMKENVREQWQIHLRCGWLQMDNTCDGSSRCGLNVGYKQKRLKKTFEHKLLAAPLKSTATSSTSKSLGCVQGPPSEMIFPNDDMDEDTYCFSSLGCEVMPDCARRILPVEIKMNSSHKDFFSINLSRDAHLLPPLGWEKC
uniref:Adhesion G-protein coupled receptor G4 n=1 Tax=Ictidomys tridecemlineatus TaxID=43179 RepID=I3N0P2_ICTTR